MEGRPDFDARFTLTLQELDSLSSDISLEDALQEVCDILVETVSEYPWVGIYVLEGDMLHLKAWQGPQPTEHVVIPVDKGICGMAVREERTIVVDDVRASPEYISCFINTRSEIVVPIHHDGRVVGEIDIDGDEVGTFNETDREFLEYVADVIISRFIV